MPDLIPMTPIDLDRPRQLYFDHRAVRQSEIELTRRWGQPRTFYSAMLGLVSAVATGMVGDLSLTDLTVLLWQGLMRDDPALTFETVEAALPYYTPVALGPYVVTLLEAWTAVSPPAQPQMPTEGEAAAPDPLDGSTGNASGPLLVATSR
jgi:hypothetical protein